MPSIAAMPDEPKRPAKLFQHRNAPVTFDGPTAFSIQQAKIARFGDKLHAIAVRYADLEDVNYGELNPREQARYLKAARIGWESIGKDLAL